MFQNLKLLKQCKTFLFFFSLKPYPLHIDIYFNWGSILNWMYCNVHCTLTASIFGESEDGLTVLYNELTT